MLFMLKWNRFYNFSETILGIDHIYTFKNAKENKINYRIEGFMLLAIFAVKAAKAIYHTIQ